jgi:surface antigen
MITTFVIRAAILAFVTVFAVACSTVEPLDGSMVTSTPAEKVPSDQSAIAEAVGNADPGVPLAWANPATGSAGVIQQIHTGSQIDEQCRSFVTTRRTLSNETVLSGTACRSVGSSWKITKGNANSAF